MHRVIAGCNLWAVLFLLVSLVLGYFRAAYHVPFALFSTLFAMLSQCAIFALFMGASKLLKEHVERFHLPLTLIDRTNTLMIPLFRWASVGSMVVLLLAILGGLSISGDAPPILHVAAGILTMVVLAVVVPREVRQMAAMHEVLLDMEAAVPEDASTIEQDTTPDLRPRALVYVGSTCLAMVLGYKFIAGLTVPPLLFAMAIGLSLLCLVVAGLLTTGVLPGSRESSPP